MRTPVPVGYFTPVRRLSRPLSSGLFEAQGEEKFEADCCQYRQYNQCERDTPLSFEAVRGGGAALDDSRVAEDCSGPPLRIVVAVQGIGASGTN